MATSSLPLSPKLVILGPSSLRHLCDSKIEMVLLQPNNRFGLREVDEPSEARVDLNKPLDAKVEVMVGQ